MQEAFQFSLYLQALETKKTGYGYSAGIRDAVGEKP